MRKQGFACVDCGGYAPPNGEGWPMWPGPRCTLCACKQYARQHGCAPAEAEHHLYEERAQQTPKIGSSHPPCPGDPDETSSGRLAFSISKE